MRVPPGPFGIIKQVRILGSKDGPIPGGRDIVHLQLSIENIFEQRVSFYLGIRSESWKNLPRIPKEATDFWYERMLGGMTLTPIEPIKIPRRAW